MNRRLAAFVIIACALIIFGILWYVAEGLQIVSVAVVAFAVSLSIAYLFYEALSCRKLRRHIVGLQIFRRLDIKEFLRIFGPVALLPLSSIIIARHTLNSSISPLRLYILFVLLFLVGWALGTVETSKLINDDGDEKGHS